MKAVLAENPRHPKHSQQLPVDRNLPEALQQRVVMERGHPADMDMVAVRQMGV